ncbi:MAG TPA: SGNH/GDSL hydrolase family protein [Bryobacteraceae bacterium]|jgi:lysophospholipase L1-like esterase|nr:SGNH/GDSL hydrolase family protein [Bryobacteraceae bacterium]
MKRTSLQLAIALTVLTSFACPAVFAAVPADSKSKVARKKKYRSSAARTSAAAGKPSLRRVRRVIPKGPLVSAKIRAEAHEGVFANIANGAEIPVENSAALVPFFELLYRHQKGELPGPVRILHYGDSHTAADEWTGDLRTRFQEKFGDGGSGYSFAGRPWNGYRREDVRTGSTKGWHTDGLVGRAGDGIYGLGGVSMTTKAPREAVYLQAEGQSFELFYLQQPGGGTIQIYDNGALVERISTSGEEEPGYFHYDTAPGAHKLEVETLDRAPVRLFGWVAENSTGVTYETLGINGAQASIQLDWNEPVLKSNIARRNPSLIVLAYGTNEAGQRAWTLESYRRMFEELIGRIRDAAPTATIFVVGPPDRYIHTRKGWVAMDQIDMIIEAQRQAAAATGCAFWDLRAKMGGKGSMRQWVLAGMAQNDHVHFTAPGYHLLGDAVFRDLMSQYDLFVKARADSVADAAAPVKQ